MSDRTEVCLLPIIWRRQSADAQEPLAIAQVGEGERGMMKNMRVNEKSGQLCRRSKVAAFVKFHQTSIPSGSGEA